MVTRGEGLWRKVPRPREVKEEVFKQPIKSQDPVNISFNLHCHVKTFIFYPF